MSIFQMTQVSPTPLACREMLRVVFENYYLEINLDIILPQGYTLGKPGLYPRVETGLAQILP